MPSIAEEKTNTPEPRANVNHERPEGLDEIVKNTTSQDPPQSRQLNDDDVDEDENSEDCLSDESDTGTLDSDSLSFPNGDKNTNYIPIDWPTDDQVPLTDRYDFFINHINMGEASPKDGSAKICEYIEKTLGVATPWPAKYQCLLSMNNCDIRISCLVIVSKIEFAYDTLKEPRPYASCEFIEISNIEIDPPEEAANLLQSEETYHDFTRQIYGILDEKCKWIRLTDNLRPALILESGSERSEYNQRKTLERISKIINMVRFWEIHVFRPYDVQISDLSFKNYEQLLKCRLNNYDMLCRGFVSDEVESSYDYYNSIYYEVLGIIAERMDKMTEVYSTRKPTSNSIFSLEEMDAENDAANAEYNQEECRDLIEYRNELSKTLQIMEREGLTSLPEFNSRGKVPTGKRIRNGLRMLQMDHVPVLKAKESEEIVEETNPDQPGPSTIPPTEKASNTENPLQQDQPPNVVHFTPGPLTLTTLALAEHAINDSTRMFIHEKLDNAIDDIHENETLFITKTIFEPEIGLSYLNEDNIKIVGLDANASINEANGHGPTHATVDGPALPDIPNIRVLGDNIILENLTFIQNDTANSKEDVFLMLVESRNCVLKNCRLICTSHGIELKQNSKLTLINTEIIKENNQISANRHDPDHDLDRSVGILQREGSKLILKEKCKISGFKFSTQIIRVIGDETSIGKDCEINGPVILSKKGHVNDDELIKETERLRIAESATNQDLEMEVEKMVRENAPAGEPASGQGDSGEIAEQKNRKEEADSDVEENGNNEQAGDAATLQKPYRRLSTTESHEGLREKYNISVGDQFDLDNLVVV